MRSTCECFLATSIIILLQWHSAQAAEGWTPTAPEFEVTNETSQFDNSIHLFNRWGPDWRIEWNFTIVDAKSDPYDAKLRPVDQQPWAPYKNNCTKENTTAEAGVEFKGECHKYWFNVFHFSKGVQNFDREPGLWMHWYTGDKKWHMRLDLSEPHLNDTANFNSWDWPDFHKVERMTDEGTNHNLTIEQVRTEPKAGVNKTLSKLVIYADGKDQNVSIPSRFVPRANMELWWSDPWHLPAGEAVVKTDSFKVYASKEWNVNMAFNCYIKGDWKGKVRDVVNYEEHDGRCFVQSTYGMLPSNGTFHARRGGNYYFSFTGYMKVEEGEFQLGMVRAHYPTSNHTTVARIGLGAPWPTGEATEAPPPANATKPPPANKTAILRDSEGPKKMVRSMVMNAVLNLAVNDAVYIEVQKNSNPEKNYLVENIGGGKALGTRFLGIGV